MKRPIITIDEEKCNGCGQCILDCAEGALAIVDGKARLVSEVYCDGLGACLNCPQGALRLETRDAAPFDSVAAMRAMSGDVSAASCPGAVPRELVPPAQAAAAGPAGTLAAQLPSWPIQLALLTPDAAFLDNAHLLLAAHCSGFALPGLHAGLMAGRIPVIACPKLEDNAPLATRLAAILRERNISSLTVLRMSVHCCRGLERMVGTAMEMADRRPEYAVHVVNLR